MTLASGCVRGSIVHTDNSGFTELPPPPPPPLSLSLASPLSSACSTRAAAHALQLSMFKSGLQWEQQQGCTAATQRRTTAAAAAAAAAAVAAQSLSGSLAVPLHCLTPVLLCLVRCSPLLSTQCACMQRQHSSDHTRRQAAGDQQAPASASPCVSLTAVAVCVSLLSRCCVSLLCCVMCVRHERANEQQQQQQQRQQREAEQRCCITRSTPDARSCASPTSTTRPWCSWARPWPSCRQQAVIVLRLGVIAPWPHTALARFALPTAPSRCLARPFSHALSHCQSKHSSQPFHSRTPRRHPSGPAEACTSDPHLHGVCTAMWSDHSDAESSGGTRHASAPSMSGASAHMRAAELDDSSVALVLL